MHSGTFALRAMLYYRHQAYDLSSSKTNVVVDLETPLGSHEHGKRATKHLAAVKQRVQADGRPRCRSKSCLSIERQLPCKL